MTDEQQLSELIKEHQGLVDFQNTPKNQPRIKELAGKITGLKDKIAKQETRTMQQENKDRFALLLTLLTSLSPESQQKYAHKLIPILEAEKALHHFHRVQIIADQKVLRDIEAKRMPLLGRHRVLSEAEREELHELNHKAETARLKIEGRCEEGRRLDGHKVTIDALTKAYKKARSNF